MRPHATTAAVLAIALLAPAAWAASVTLGAAHDNTLIEIADGSLSNGSGEHFFSGATAFNGVRRGLISFDFSSIPAGSIITGVTLTLNMTFTITGPQAIDLHRVLAAWGEGASDGKGEEGGGAPSMPGDATWIHRFYPDQFWATPGGDFAATTSASTTVLGLAFYDWSGPGMIADVQGWLDNPSSNFGWLLLGNETTTATAKRFDTHENLTPELRPKLVVTYSLPCPADFDHSGAVNGLDLASLLAAWTGALSYAPCPPFNPKDLNHDCKVNGLDLAMLLAAWGPCPQ